MAQKMRQATLKAYLMRRFTWNVFSYWKCVVGLIVDVMHHCTLHLLLLMARKENITALLP